MKNEIWREILDCTKKNDPDPHHAIQVCRLSLSLFDCLKMLHELDKKARDMLRAGALLHDIGWSVPGKPHHKASRDKILSDQSIPFKQEERKIVALIARYHRKSLPHPDHAYYRTLDPGEQRIVQYCAGILRVADMLDRSHQAVVRTVHCDITQDSILITCTCAAPMYLDKAVFSEKCSLLENLTCHRISLSWML